MSETLRKIEISLRSLKGSNDPDQRSGTQLLVILRSVFFLHAFVAPFQGALFYYRSDVGFRSLSLVQPYAIELVPIGDCSEISTEPGHSPEHFAKLRGNSKFKALAKALPGQLV